MSKNEIELEVKDDDKETTDITGADEEEERQTERTFKLVTYTDTTEAEEQQSEILFENLTETCQHIKQEFLTSILKWSRAFQESENIDLFFEKRLDELIQEAEQTEESLKAQKQILKEKLKCLTKTLTQIAENES